MPLRPAPAGPGLQAQESTNTPGKGHAHSHPSRAQAQTRASVQMCLAEHTPVPREAGHRWAPAHPGASHLGRRQQQPHVLSLFFILIFLVLGLSPGVLYPESHPQSTLVLNCKTRSCQEAEAGPELAILLAWEARHRVHRWVVRAVSALACVSMAPDGMRLQKGDLAPSAALRERRGRAPALGLRLLWLPVLQVRLKVPRLSWAPAYRRQIPDS